MKKIEALIRHFKLDDVPDGDSVPLVIQVGKWRREVSLSHVTACQDNPVLDKDLTRLPRTQGEGNIPHTAIAICGFSVLSAAPRSATTAPPSRTKDRLIRLSLRERRS